MTVAELIVLLQTCDQDAVVLVRDEGGYMSEKFEVYEYAQSIQSKNILAISGE